jgi:gas vesicle protein
VVERKKIVGGTLVALAAGYMVGILTAPRSGKKTRKQLKKTADHSIADLEKQLKNLHKQGQSLIDKFNKQNPKVSAKLKDVKAVALRNQAKLKELLSAIHGNDSVDEDLDKALRDAKDAFSDLSKYLSKK